MKTVFSSRFFTEFHRRFGLPVALALLLACGVAWAFPVGEGDHEQARLAVEQGRVMHLHDILSGIEHEFQGQVLNIEFDRERAHGQAGRPGVEYFVYKIRLLQTDGRVVKLRIDAATGRVLDVKRKER